jgi:glycosyltransferase involved in cell wall biosynthesis
MRVVILAPWFRNLAHVHASLLEADGNTAWIVATGSQPYPLAGKAQETLLSPRLRGGGVLRQFVRTAMEVRRFNPDAAIVDDCWDPRFAALALLCPRRMVLVHDAFPHDDAHRDNWWKRIVRTRLRVSASSFGAFSEYVASQLRGKGAPVEKLALPTEFSALEPQGQEEVGRTGFLFLGRLGPYKGLDFLLRSWKKVLPYLPANERLYVMVSGHGEVENAPGVVVRQGTYDETQVRELLSTVRAVVLPYVEASQSGVQVLAMQFGVPTVVTNVGALPEMQPIGAPVVPYGDEDALGAALMEMCDPNVHRAISTTARETYRDRHSGSAISLNLIGALEKMIR